MIAVDCAKNRILNPVQAIPVDVQAKEQSGIDDGGEWVAKFMAEHRQKFIFTMVKIGQSCCLFLCLSLQPASLRTCSASISSAL